MWCQEGILGSDYKFWIPHGGRHSFVIVGGIAFLARITNVPQPAYSSSHSGPHNVSQIGFLPTCLSRKFCAASTFLSTFRGYHPLVYHVYGSADALWFAKIAFSRVIRLLSTLIILPPLRLPFMLPQRSFAPVVPGRVRSQRHYELLRSTIK